LLGNLRRRYFILQRDRWLPKGSQFLGIGLSKQGGENLQKGVACLLVACLTVKVH